MLPKQYRLKNAKAFEATYRNHKIISDEYVCVYFGKQKNDNSINTRFGFVVSKKIHKRAVVRNKIKRLMRESVRLIIKNNYIKNIHRYMSIICVAKPESINSDFSTINTSLHRIFENVK